MMITTAFFPFLLALAAPEGKGAPAGKCIDPKAAPLVIADKAANPFAPGSAEFSKLQANIDAAFRQACVNGLLQQESLIELGGSGGWIELENIPDGNAAIFGATFEKGRGWHLVLEYPFVPSDGSVNVPNADEIEEAIYCAVVGATPEEQEASGRCLVD